MYIAMLGERCIVHSSKQLNFVFYPFINHYILSHFFSEGLSALYDDVHVEILVLSMQLK